KGIGKGLVQVHVHVQVQGLRNLEHELEHELELTLSPALPLWQLPPQTPTTRANTFSLAVVNAVASAPSTTASSPTAPTPTPRALPARRLHHPRGLQPQQRPQALLDRLDQQIAVPTDPSAEHDQLGIEHGRHRCHRARKVLGLDAHHLLRALIPLPRRIEHFL